MSRCSRRGSRRGEKVAAQLVAFIRRGATSLDLALYDFRLSDPLKAVVAAAIRERAAAGVAIRIAYDADKPEPPKLRRAWTPRRRHRRVCPVARLSVPAHRRAEADAQQVIVRDLSDPARRTTHPARRSGRARRNFTDDAWNVEENNILQIASPASGPLLRARFRRSLAGGRHRHQRLIRHESGDIAHMPARP